jgi:hypothetical protein
MTDASAQLSETATYCKPNDPKRPRLVGLPDASTSQICPDDGSATTEVDNAYPDGWYVRVMFDELLDPRIEELTEILDDDGVGTGTFEGSVAGTHPVTLECQSVLTGQMVNVSYDGYYSPSGNSVTWPLGPSLVIKPNDPTLIATGKECQITLSNLITDKDGVEVPTEQRGPYKFKVAEIAPLATDPTDSLDTTEPTEVDAFAPYNDNFYFQFNTEVQVSSFCADTDFGGTGPLFTDAWPGFGSCDAGTENFQLTPPVLNSDATGLWGTCSRSRNGTRAIHCDTNADCPLTTGERCEAAYAYTYNGLKADDEIGIGYNTPLKTETVYTFSLKPGTKLKDRCGAETEIPAPEADNLYSITFKTLKLDLNSINIANGETASMTKQPTLLFNQIIDYTTLDKTEYTITPEPDQYDDSSPVNALGNYFGNEIWPAGVYQPNTTYTFTLKKGATVEDYYGAVYTAEEDQTIMWKTAPKILQTTSTADKSVLTKIFPSQLIGVSVNFNAHMDVSTLDTTEFTLVNKAGADMTALPTFLKGVGSSGSGAICDYYGLSCSFRFRADLPPDDYTFTLKKGAKISDISTTPNEYTQENDLVIHFTVKPPVSPVQCL